MSMSSGNVLETLIVELALKIDDIQKKIDSVMNQAEARAKSGGRAIENAMRSSVSASTAMLHTLSLAIGASGIGLTAVGGMAINLAMKFEQAKIAFTSFLGDATKAQQFIEELQQFAARTPFTFSGLQKASQQLLAFGFEAKAIIPTMTAIGGAVARVGGGEDAINRVTRALTQMLSSGRLSAEEMNQLADAGIQAWPMLAEKMGKSIADVRKMAEKGQISGAQAVQTLLEGMSVGAEQFLKDQAATMAGLMSNAKDSIEISLAIIGQEIIDTFDLKTKLAGAIETMSTLTDLLKEKGLKGAFLEIFPPDTHIAIFAIVGAIAGALVPAIIALGVAIGGVMFLLAPFMIAGAALAALAYTTRDSWMPIAQQLLPQLGSAFSWLGSEVKQYSDGIGRDFDRLGRWIRETQAFILNTLADIVDFLNPWVITIVYLWNQVGQKFGELGNYIGNIIQTYIVPIINWWKDVNAEVSNDINNKLTGTGNTFGWLGNYVIPIIHNIGGALVWLAGKMPIIGSVVSAVQGVSNFIARVRGRAAEANADLSSELSNLTEQMRMNANAAKYLSTAYKQDVQPELEDTFQTVEQLEKAAGKLGKTTGGLGKTLPDILVPGLNSGAGAADGLGKSAGGAKEKVEDLKTALEELSISAGMMRDAMELAGIDTDRQTMALINLGVAAIDAGPLLEGLNVTVDKLALAFQRAGLSAEDMQRTLNAIAAKQAAAIQEKADREAEAARKEQERRDKEENDRREAELKDAARREVTGEELANKVYPITDPIQKLKSSVLQDDDQYLNEQAQAMFDDWSRQFMEFGRDAGLILERIFNTGTLGDPSSVAELQALIKAWELLPPELQVGLDKVKEMLLKMIEEFNLNLDGTVNLAKKNRAAIVAIEQERIDLIKEQEKQAYDQKTELWIKEGEQQSKLANERMSAAEKEAELLRQIESSKIAAAQRHAAADSKRRMEKQEVQERLLKAFTVLKQFGGATVDNMPVVKAIADYFKLGIGQLVNFASRNMTVTPDLWNAVDMPQFATGGVVNAAMGVPVPAMLHGQERVLSAGQNAKIEQLLAGILSATKSGHVLDVDGRELGRTTSVGMKRRGMGLARYGG